jgi:plastocyanin
MTKKQIAIIVAFALVVLGGVVVGFVFRNGGINTPFGNIGGGNEPIGGSVATSTGGQSPEAYYSSEIPKDAVLSVPSSSAPAGPGSSATLDMFHMNISKTGFSPDTLTVKAGGRVSLTLTAVDGDYDILVGDFAYQFVKKGETKPFGFELSVAPGTYVMRCRDFCPVGGEIRGSLIVLPK